MSLLRKIIIDKFSICDILDKKDSTLGTHKIIIIYTNKAIQNNYYISNSQQYLQINEVVTEIDLAIILYSCHMHIFVYDVTKLNIVIFNPMCNLHFGFK